MILSVVQVVVLLLFLLILLSIVYYSIRCGISPMPSSGKATRIIAQLIANAHSSSEIIEAGAGFGFLAGALANKFPHVHITAYELSPVPFIVARICAFVFRCRNLTICRRDFFKENFSSANVVVCYLYPGAMLQMKEKLIAELPADSLVISNTFAVPGWNAREIVEVNDLYRTKIYSYLVNMAQS